MGNYVSPSDCKREAWRLLEDKHLDIERARQLKRDDTEVRNEYILQRYYWDSWTCKEIGQELGLDESTVYRIVSTCQPVPPEDYDAWLEEA